MQEWNASMAFYSLNFMSFRADMGNIPALQIAQPCFWHASELHVCPAVPQRALQSGWEWPLNPIQYHQADLCQSGTDREQTASVTRETRGSRSFQTTGPLMSFYCRFQAKTVAFTLPLVNDVLSFKTNFRALEASRKALWNPRSLWSLEGEREKTLSVPIWDVLAYLPFAFFCLFV